MWRTFHALPCSAALTYARDARVMRTQHYGSLLAGGASPARGFHLALRRSSPKFYLHPLVSAATARSYAKAAAGSPPCTVSVSVGGLLRPQ